MQSANDFTLCQANALVQGIVDALVGSRNDLLKMATVAGRNIECPVS